MTENLMTIREMCDAYDVTARTLRFYESKELLAPRREGQKRLFTHRDRARLTLILRGKRFGFSLEEIRQLLDMWDGGKGRVAQLDRAVEVARDRLHELRQQRSDLDSAIAELQEQLTGAERMLEAVRAPQAAA